MTPAVSVVTIFLDAAPFLQEAIDSVVGQTFEDWELVLVDDGSTDGSTEIARAAAAADPRVRYVEHTGHERRGMSASRNAGIAESGGRYVALLDADDVYLPEKLARQVVVLDAHGEVDMVYGPMTLWFGWTGDPADVARDFVYRTKLPAGRVLEPPSVFVAYMREEAPSPATCSVLLRRDAIERVGGFDPAFRGMFEDKVFFHKLALDARILVLDDALDRYRQHPGSTTSVALATGEWRRSGDNPTGDRFVEWLSMYADEHPEHAAVIRRELRRLGWSHRWRASVPGRAVRRARKQNRA